MHVCEYWYGWINSTVIWVFFKFSRCIPWDRTHAVRHAHTPFQGMARSLATFGHISLLQLTCHKDHPGWCIYKYMYLSIYIYLYIISTYQPHSHHYVYIYYIYICIYICRYLVGGWPSPLRNMSSSTGMMTFPTERTNKKVTFQTTNQS